jgi:integrase
MRPAFVSFTKPTGAAPSRASGVGGRCAMHGLLRPMSGKGRLRRFGRGPVNVGSWHVRDVTPAATRAAAIKGGAAIPARSPFMLRPRCRTLRALSCSDPNMVQKWLGHAQLTTTAIYANAVGEEEQSIAARMW